MNNPETRPFEEKVFLATLTPEPSQEFADGLWKRIERLPRRQWEETSISIWSLIRPAWRAAALILLAALVATLLAIGPARVLAQVQHWLGYVPGIGFVDLSDTRVLGSPVEVTRQGVTLRVEQVIAGPDVTLVKITSPGVTEEVLPYPNEAVENADFSAFLLLPDGARLTMTRWELNVGSGRLEFPALPGGVSNLSLLVARLPLVPAGALPEDWEIPLRLRPATGEPADDLFPQPYSPSDASETRHGITLRVLNVAQTAAETAIQYQVEWPDRNWEFRFGPGYDRSPELRDDLGHVYWESPPATGSSVSVVAVAAGEGAQPATPPAAPGHAGTLVFPALSLSATQATLWVDGLEFVVPAEGRLEIDFGENPQVGDRWPLDIRLEIAGFPVHLTAARLGEETVEHGDGRSERRTFLEFELEPLYEREGFRLAAFDLANSELGIYGQGGRAISGGVERYRGRVALASESIPSGRVELLVERATLLAYGPWEVSWDIPGRESAKAAPARLIPETTTRPDSPLKPTVEEVFLSDRLTGVEFSAQGLPEGATFLQAIPYDPAAYDPARPAAQLYLEDNWGRRYESGKNLAFLRPGGDEAGFDSRWQFFSPLQPLAQGLTLHVPAMEALLPGEAGFTVEIPQGLSFHEEEYTVKVIGGGGPERAETTTRTVSDPWPVDISLDLAGFRLHFTRAQVERDERAGPAYRLLLTGEPPERGKNGFRLNSLRFSAVERPDGETLRIDPELQNRGLLAYPYGFVGQVEAGSSRMQVMMALDVTAADRADLLAGSYRVELNGVTVWVAGPWELSWSLSGQ